MTRPLYFLPFIALAVFTAILAYRQGMIAANLTETEVINTYAARYVAETGGNLEDCEAVPGQGRVWLKIYCTRADGLSVSYLVDKRGVLIPHARTDEVT
jgi:hypothetical protein